MKIGVFGCGSIYRKYRTLIPNDHEIVVFVDNDITNHDALFEGHRRVYPREVVNYQMDLIVLMSDSATQMRTQLIRCGWPENKIVHYKDYLGSRTHKNVKYLAKTSDSFKKNLLIISNELGYHGGPVVVLRTAKCASNLGYKVTITASNGNKDFIDELNEAGFDVIIQEWLEHASLEKLKWMMDFDVVIANTFPVIKCACRISSFRNVIVWLHDCPDVYESLEYWHEEIQNGLFNNNLTIYTVSERAKEHLLRFYECRRNTEILPVAVEDWKVDKSDCEKKIVIAIIASFAPHKGQDILLSAIRKIDINKRCSFLFVGKSDMDEYGRKVNQEIMDIEKCIYVGEKSTDEMKMLYRFVDIVVVPSRDETFSLTAAEAMMLGKVCIVSDNCGITEYIENRKNAIVFKTGDDSTLAEIIKWCVLHKEECLEIGQNARKTYENYFTMTSLEDNLERIFKKCV